MKILEKKEMTLFKKNIALKKNLKKRKKFKDKYKVSKNEGIKKK